MKGTYPTSIRRFADPIKSVVDKVVDAKKSQRIAWEVLTQGGTITRNTLYGQINQGMRYLLTHMDPAGVYRKILVEDKERPIPS